MLKNTTNKFRFCFQLYDVLDETNVFYPNTIDTKPIKVGAPVMTGVKPKDELSNIFVHAREYWVQNRYILRIHLSYIEKPA